MARLVQFKKTEEKYLYLTIMNSKKGKLIEYFIRDILPYEELPNLFVGDKTRNIRIPINESTLQYKEMHFLLEKYRNTYAIQGIPIETILGTLSIDYKYKNQLYVYCGSASDSQLPKVVSIISTIKQLYEVEEDIDVYKKLVKRIIGLFPTPPDLEYTNMFGKLLLPYPEKSSYGKEENMRVVRENESYISSCLILGFTTTNINAMDYGTIITVYQNAYNASKQYYKNVMKEYEEEQLGKL